MRRFKKPALKAVKCELCRCSFSTEHDLGQHFDPQSIITKSFPLLTRPPPITFGTTLLQPPIPWPMNINEENKVEFSRKDNATSKLYILTPFPGKCHRSYYSGRYIKRDENSFRQTAVPNTKIWVSIASFDKWVSGDTLSEAFWLPPAVSQSFASIACVLVIWFACYIYGIYRTWESNKNNFLIFWSKIQVFLFEILRLSIIFYDLFSCTRWLDLNL